MKVKLVDAALPLHPELTHPATGQPLRAVFQRGDGSFVWPHLGSDGEEEGGEGEKEKGENDDEEDDDKEEDEEKESKKSNSKKTYSSEEYDELKRKYEARTKHLSEADKKRSAAEKALDERNRKEKSDLENAQTDLKKIQEEHSSLQGRFKKLALVNAFLTASAQEKIAWHNPATAQRAADLGELEIDEEGNVEGIRDAVKKLAKEQPFLVNSSSENEEDGDNKSSRNGNGRRGSTGSGVGSTKTSKGKGKTDTLSDDQLRARFPALRR